MSQDLKFGLRMLLRKPLLTIGISLSLALGIGANSAVFSLVDAVLFRPMNVGNPTRLVSLYTSDYSGPQYGGSSYADFADFRDQTNVFENLAVLTEISPALRSESVSNRAFGLLVSENYFDLLGVKAASGRTFQAGDDAPVLVVSHSFWQRRFGGDPAVVGKTVFLNNNSFTIIGITRTIGVENYTPRAGENMEVMNGVVGTDYFRTMGMTLIAGRSFTEQDKEGAPRTIIVNQTLAQYYWPGQKVLGKHITVAGNPREVVGVVKDATAYIFQKTSSPFFYLPHLQNASAGLTLHVRTKGEPMAILPTVRNAVDGLGQNVFMRNPRTLTDTMNDSLIMLRVASTLTGLFGLVALALAVVGVFSVVNYSTSRRTREIGIRLALGAQRADIFRMILNEAVFIVAAGVVAGLLMAFASTRLISSFLFADSGKDVFVYIAVAVMLIAIAMLACFIPAHKATRVDPSHALRHE